MLVSHPRDLGPDCGDGPAVTGEQLEHLDQGEDAVERQLVLGKHVRTVAI